MSAALKIAGAGAALGLALLYFNGGKEVLAAYQEDPEGVAEDEVVVDDVAPTEEVQIEAPSVAANILTAIGGQLGSMAAEKAVEKGLKAFSSKEVKPPPEPVKVVKAPEPVDPKVAAKEITAAAKVEAKVETAVAAKVEAKVETQVVDKVATQGVRAIENRGTAVAGRAASKIAGKVAGVASKLGKLAGGPAAFISAILTTVISLGADLDSGSFEACKDGEVDLDKLPEAAKFAIGLVPFLGDMFSVLSPVLCFKGGCTGKDGRTQEENGLCYVPCVPDYKSDGAVLCYKQYPTFEANGQGHTITSITKRIYSDPGVPLSDCPNSEKQGAVCYPNCREGFEGLLTVCRKKCPPGTNQTVVRCEKASYGRGVGRIPDKGPCDGGQRDDGTSCWEDFRCNTWCDGNWNWSDGGFCHTQCSGCGCIKKSLFDRQVCNSDEEMAGGLCYKKCVDGYHGEGPVCWSNEGPYDRETYDRGVGEPMKCAPGLLQISALCYPVPPAGYSRQSVGLLSQDCPAGSKDFGVGCVREQYNRGIGYIPLEVKMKKRTSYYGNAV